MNHLLSIRTNTLYSKGISKDGEETYDRYRELIFLVDKPQYISTNEGAIVRQRAVEEFRFIVSDLGIEIMIQHLSKIQEGD